MLCPKCGAQNGDDSRFCLNCGQNLTIPQSALPQETPAASAPQVPSPVEAPAAPQAVPAAPATQCDPMSYAPAQADAAPAPQPAFVQPENTANVPAEYIPPADAPGKKKKKKGVKWIVTGAVAAVVLLLAGAGWLFYPKIMQAVLGPEKYYFMAEKKALTAGAKSLAEQFEDIMNTPLSASGDVKFVVEGLDALPEEMQSEELDAVVAQLDKASIHVEINRDAKQGLSSSKVAASYDGQTLAEVLVQQTKDRIGLSLPGLSDGQYVANVSGEWLIKLLSADKTEWQQLTGLTDKQRDKLLNSLIENVLVKSFPKENVVKGSDTYDDIKCSTTTFVIDETVIGNLIENLAKELDRTEIRTICEYAVQYAYDRMKEIVGEEQAARIPFPSDEEINEAIDNLIDELESVDAEGLLPEDTELEYTVFYNSRGRVVAREFQQDDGYYKNAVVLATYAKGSQHVQEFKYSTKGEKLSNTITIRNDYTNKGGKIDGKMTAGATYTEGKTTYCTVTYTGEQDVKVGGVPMFIGEVKLTVDGGTIGASELGEISLIYTTAKNGGSAVDTSLLASITIEEKTIKAGLKGTLTYSDKANVGDVSVAEKSTLTEEDLPEIGEKLMQRVQEIFGDLFGGTAQAPGDDPDPSYPSDPGDDPGDEPDPVEPGISGGMTMQDFIASIQDEIDEMASSMEGAGLKLTVAARGNSLAYSYQYTFDVGDVSLVRDALGQSLDGMASTFEGILSAMKPAVPNAQSVIVEFLDQNGTIIVSKEFK